MWQDGGESPGITLGLVLEPVSQDCGEVSGIPRFGVKIVDYKGDHR